MDERNAITAKIIDLEWKMFQNTKNSGGRAPCQDDYRTFNINRSSQAQSWPVPALASYLEDLLNADRAGRNLVAEKYARMMAWTSPIEFKAIAHRLPPVEDDVVALIRKIIAIVLEWEQVLAEKYPNVARLGRPIRSSQDTQTVTSVETYLKGELQTYSKKTIELIYSDYLEKQSAGISGSEVILEQMIKHYGFTSLPEAENAARSRANKPTQTMT